MTRYIFDTGVLSRIMEHYYPSRFPSFWKIFDEYLRERRIISVKEVKKELENWGGLEPNTIKDLTKNIFFEEPTEQELNFINKLFINKEYQNLISEKNRLLGKPCADPYLIAKAYVSNKTLITTEKYRGKDKNGKHKKTNIPSVCKDYKIFYVNLEGFMERENWKF